MAKMPSEEVRIFLIKAKAHTMNLFGRAVQSVFCHFSKSPVDEVIK